MNGREFVAAAEEYRRSNGWETERNQLREGVYAIAGSREGSKGVEHSFLFVVPDENAEVTEELVSNAADLAADRDADAAITTRGRYTEAALEAAKAAGIERVPPDSIGGTASGFGDDITMPDPAGTAEGGDGDEGHRFSASDDGEAGSGVPTSGSAEATDEGDRAPTQSDVGGEGSRFDGDDSTLEVEQASRLGDSTKHYNTDNIAFFQSVNISVTLLGKLLLYGLPTLLAGVVFAEFNRPVVAVVVFLALFLPQWYLMRFRDRAIIGTLSSNDRIASNELDTLETLFKRSAANLITIAGTKKRLFWHLDYRHHLVPENIVSVQRASRVRGKLYFLGIFIVLFAVRMAGRVLPLVGGYVDPQSAAIQVGVLTLLAYAVEMGYITLPLRLGDGVIGKTVQYGALAVVVTVLPTLLQAPRQLRYLVAEPQLLLQLVLPALLLGFVLGVFLRGTRNAVLVQLQSGVDKVFVMGDDDAERVVSEFKQR